MKEILLTKGKVALVDDDDFHTLSCYQWHYNRHNGRGVGYAQRCTTVNGKNVTIFMHREVMQAPKGILVDHRDFNTLNNQKENLRLCDRFDNQANRRKGKNSKSTYKGVVFIKRGQKWAAQIKRKDFIFRSKRFQTEEEAARAYDAKAIELFGEFACLNFPLEKMLLFR